MILPNSKPYKVTIIKMICHWTKNDKLINAMEGSELGPLKYSQ